MAVYTLVLDGVIALMVRFEHGMVARQDVTPGTVPGTTLPTMLLMLVADVLGLLILILCCMPGTNGPNAFGERPDAPLP